MKSAFRKNVRYRCDLLRISIEQLRTAYAK